MLEIAIGTEYVPGTNVRGQRVGANWTFLLPSLELDLVVCIGPPTATELAALSRIAKSVCVTATPSSAGRSLSVWAERQGLDNVRTAHLSELEPASADLLLVTDGHDGPVGSELAALVRPEGSIYVEGRPIDLGESGSAARLWLTPLRGEMRTAVLWSGRPVIDYFVRNRLCFPTFDVHAVKAITRPDGSLGGGRAVRPVRRLSGRTMKRVLRSAGRALLEIGARIEAAVLSRPVVGRLFGRAAFLTGPDTGAPPRYLCEIGRASGLDVSDWRWGFAAHSQYISRKVLFFLWENGHGDPDVVVKLTRDPQLNPRLRNEGQALRTLEQKGVRDVPRVVFDGMHAGLVVLGQSAVHGVPFRSKSSARADCRFARSAVDWLVELGHATAESTAPAEAADPLRDLHERFVSLYRPREDEARFLSSQIETIASSARAFPTVFQHGDAGTWNTFVTGDGRVAFLDWEAAEPRGVPLWDLFYWLRSFAVACGRAKRCHDPLLAIESELVTEGPVGRLLTNSVRSYCGRTGLDPRLVEPLFHACWMHRALKEVTRLPDGRLEGGHYVALLRLGMAHRGQGTLQKLFSLEPGQEGLLDPDHLPDLPEVAGRQAVEVHSASDPLP